MYMSVCNDAGGVATRVRCVAALSAGGGVLMYFLEKKKETKVRSLFSLWAELTLRERGTEGDNCARFCCSRPSGTLEGARNIHGTRDAVVMQLCNMMCV